MAYTGKRTGKSKFTAEGDPYEELEQSAFYRWACGARATTPALWLLTSIPNERECPPQIGAKLRRMGQQKGYPDMFLAFPAGRYHGLYIEFKGRWMKTRKDGGVRPDQQEWRDRLMAQGYAWVVAYTWEEAMKATLAYLDGSFASPSAAEWDF